MLTMRSSMAVSALQRAIAEVKQRWSVVGWVTKNLLSRAQLCLGKHVKPLVPAAFAVVSTHQSALGSRRGCSFSLCVIHKEGLCPSSRDNNRLLLMMTPEISAIRRQRANHMSYLQYFSKLSYSAKTCVSRRNI
jgi:hypothetical protein